MCIYKYHCAPRYVCTYVHADTYMDVCVYTRALTVCVYTCSHTHTERLQPQIKTVRNVELRAMWNQRLRAMWNQHNTATHCNTLQPLRHTATHYSTLQHTMSATHCSTMQDTMYKRHTATHCKSFTLCIKDNSIIKDNWIIQFVYITVCRARASHRIAYRASHRMTHIHYIAWMTHIHYIASMTHIHYIASMTHIHYIAWMTHIHYQKLLSGFRKDVSHTFDQCAY